MDLLFKREQSSRAGRGVSFKLWGKIELDEDEQSIVSKYKFDQAVLIFAYQPGLLRGSIIVGVLVMAAAMLLLYQTGTTGTLIALAVGAVAGYWWYHQKRETIYVKDLLHGRHFNCDSVVALARKEAWLEIMVSFLRQVMESAKHWDGTERHIVEALPKDEARQVIIKGL